MRAARRLAIGFIGAGRVGVALAGECARIGHDVVGFADLSAQAVRVAGRVLGRPHRRQSASRLAARCDVLFLTVPDREIGRVFGRVKSRLEPGILVAHCSGFLGADVFRSAAGSMIETLAFHPARPFPDPPRPGPAPDAGARVPLLRSCTFVLDGSPAGLRFGRRLALELGGSSLVLRGADRPLYHAMCVFASNFQHALRESAERIARELEIPAARVSGILDPLMRMTLDNMLAGGVGPTLTGPVRRGDAETVTGHVSALRERVPELVPLYVGLTRRLVDLVPPRRTGTSPARLRAVSEALDG